VAVQADLGDVSQIKRLIAEAGKQFGRLDILVNSAANFLPGEYCFDDGAGVGRITGHKPEGAVFLRASGCAAAEAEPWGDH